MTGCFPTLLPTGCADLRPMGGRDKRVPEAAYFRHLLRYKDQRFAQNPRFVYFAYNTLLRHRVLATGRMYLRQHPESTGLTLEQVKQMPEGGEASAGAQRCSVRRTSARLPAILERTAPVSGVSDRSARNATLLLHTVGGRHAVARSAGLPASVWWCANAQRSCGEQSAHLYLVHVRTCLAFHRDLLA